MVDLCWPAPAKLNLFLHVLARRPDGRHDLQTLYQFIDACDWIGFHPSARPGVRRIDHHPFDLPAHDLILRAADALGPPRTGLDIHLHKHIPPGSGLGGGSSDAATTLLVLNRLWGLGLSRAALMEIGAGLGADVPLFIRGQAGWAEGTGDRFRPFQAPPADYCLITPPCEVATCAVFNRLEPKPVRPPVEYADYAAGRCGNDLQESACALHPELRAGLTALEPFGKPQLTGSGGGMFIRCADRAAAERAVASLPADWNPQAVRGGNLHPLAQNFSPRWWRQA